MDTENRPPKRTLGVLTSGGDAPGMNAAVRAVVRSAIVSGMDVYAVYEGYRGLVEGGELIKRVAWDDVGGILHRGGTVIGTARSTRFRTPEGRLQAARNLLACKIDSLVVIGGDGSLTGANLFRQEWPSLLAQLVEQGDISLETAAAHSHLRLVGLVGSIDNDLAGTEMTIGADTALHRIIEAIDALSSTADSHQRTFVVEVMGRDCGYLALMGALASGADWVLIPENPLETDNWEDEMYERLQAGREAGRRDSIIVVAEGARDRQGNPIEAARVRQVLQERLGQDVRLTILGHVQRGGTPSAFDRYMSTILGYTAIQQILQDDGRSEPSIIGMQQNRVVQLPLMHCVSQTRQTADAVKTHRYTEAMQMRGGNFAEMLQIFNTMIQTEPRTPLKNGRGLRLAILNAGGLAPGMNTAVRAAVRIAIDQGHEMLGVKNGFKGLIEGDMFTMNWMSVAGWMLMGGSGLGTSRKIPKGSDFYAIARNFEKHQVDGLLVIGGWSAYEAAFALYANRESFPTFNIPIICLPASIDNNLPGSDVSIGADTALNSIVDAIDKIKQSAVASHRAFVVEVMGRTCGYLALMSGLSTGAERIYLPEEGVKLKDLQQDVENLVREFQAGKRLGLMIRNEMANSIYTTPFMVALFEEEGSDLFDVRQAILGHLQQGGNPTPFDRIHATQLASRCIQYLIKNASEKQPDSAFIGLQTGKLVFHDLADFPRMVDRPNQRPKNQWWVSLSEVARLLGQAPE